MHHSPTAPGTRSSSIRGMLLSLVRDYSVQSKRGEGANGLDVL